jgi:protein-L-isoaspartate(D-aspartate) O-methyltransferase
MRIMTHSRRLDQRPISGARHFLALLMGLLLAAQGQGPGCTPPPANNAPADQYQELRAAMVKEQIEARGITDPAVLAAMNQVPRHEFVPADVRPLAYTDQPLPIGHGQTISQPYIVAFMTQALELKPGDKVLEIGTGSGYQAAVLAEITPQVYSIEIICELSEKARHTLDRLGYTKVITKCGDGYQGWPEHAPFNAVIVTAAPDHVPKPLLDQLAMGGRMVIPVGDQYQELMRFTRTRDGIKKETLLPVRFVPMTGEAQKPRK